jgi:hypothetical protein
LGPLTTVAYYADIASSELAPASTQLGQMKAQVLRMRMSAATFPKRSTPSSDANASLREYASWYEARLLPLVGPSGVGKTRFALRV